MPRSRQALQTLARELIDLFNARAEAAGLLPNDREIVSVLTAMLAGCYVIHGGTEAVKAWIIAEFEKHCRAADAVAATGIEPESEHWKRTLQQ
jgi:hypothetical protein